MHAEMVENWGGSVHGARCLSSPNLEFGRFLESVLFLLSLQSMLEPKRAPNISYERMTEAAVDIPQQSAGKEQSPTAVPPTPAEGPFTLLALHGKNPTGRCAS